MKTVIAGGSGFLGGALAQALARDRHEVVILSRRRPADDRGAALSGPPAGGATLSQSPGPAGGATLSQSPGPAGGATLSGSPGLRSVSWNPDGNTGSWETEIDGADAVVNLAGESIAGRRWTAAHKQRILDSRVRATRSLVAAIRRAAAAPRVFVSGSAVGYYGDTGEAIVTEQTPNGRDFLAQVCVQWEAAARAAEARTRTVYLRTGLVLERHGGALPRMLPPFWVGGGGPIGSGRQYWPWIHLQDWVALVRFVVTMPDAAGPFNATAPTPVTNKEFARALGRVLRRPALTPAPGLALTLLLGEMAGPLLLAGQRAVPACAEALGFAFTHRLLEPALRAIFRR